MLLQLQSININLYLLPHLPCFPFFPVDKEALRKNITDELYKGFEQDRAKAEQELQAWLEHTQAHIHAHTCTLL